MKRLILLLTLFIMGRHVKEDNVRKSILLGKMNYYAENPVSTFRPAYKRAHTRSQSYFIFCLLISGLFYLVAATNSASAATYYVDPVDGNDINPGTTGEPWKTFTRARPHHSSSPTVESGDTVKFAAGYYGTVSWGQNLTSNDWITYEAEDTEDRPRIRKFRLSSSNIQNVYMIIKNFDFVWIEDGNEVGKGKGTALDIDDCSHFKIINCNFYGDANWMAYNTAGGINYYSEGASRVVTYVEVNNCNFENITNAIQGGRVGDKAIPGSGFHIYDCNITYSAIDAIQIKSPQHAKITGNTIRHTNWYRGRTGGSYNVRLEDENETASGIFAVGDTLTQGERTGILTCHQLDGLYAPSFHFQSGTAGWSTGEVTSSSGGTFTPSKSSSLDHHGDVIQLYGSSSDDPPTNNGGVIGLEISNNIIDDFYQGIFLKDFNDVLIENNLISGAGSTHVVTLHDDCANGIVRNNTIVSGTTCIKIYSNAAAGNHFDVYNNICRGYIQLNNNWGQTANIKNNICGYLNTVGGSTTKADNDVAGEYIPTATFRTWFVDYPNDCHLSGANILPADFGTTESYSTTDMDGNPRAIPDAGCYEYAPVGDIIHIEAEDCNLSGDIGIIEGNPGYGNPLIAWDPNNPENGWMNYDGIGTMHFPNDIPDGTYILTMRWKLISWTLLPPDELGGVFKIFSNGDGTVVENDANVPLNNEGWHLLYLHYNGYSPYYEDEIAGPNSMNGILSDSNFVCSEDIASSITLSDINSMDLSISIWEMNSYTYDAIVVDWFELKMIGEPGPPVILTMIVEPNIGINTVIPAAGEHIYSQNQEVSLIATRFPKCPDIYDFNRWEGDVFDPNSPSALVIMDTDKTVTATFIADELECGDECHPILQGDLNEDCYINWEDFALYCSQWLACTDPNCDPK